jgi:hypothetical protein
VTLLPQPKGRFARNDIGFVDPSGVDHDALGEALSTALYNYMHGVALERDVRQWFGRGAPRTTVPADFIAQALQPDRTTRARHRARPG